MPTKKKKVYVPPPHGLVLTFLRTLQGWSQQELADAAGTSSSVISDYERGLQKKLSRQKLEDFAALMGLPPEAVNLGLEFEHTIRAIAPGPAPGSKEESRRIEAAAADAGRVVAETFRTLLSSLSREGRILRERELAQTLWHRLMRCSPAQRLALVEEKVELRSWALCERLCEESVKAAADSAERARELAELALRLAELAPGAEDWRLRLQGFAWAFVGNARRVGGTLPSADEAFARFRELWEHGATGDEAGLLDEALVLGLEASLRREQRRLGEALKLLDRALPRARVELRSQLLVNKARTLEELGDFAGAVAVLARLAPLIEKDQDLLSFQRFNLAVNLCHLGRYEEAGALLPELRVLLAQRGNGLDAVRLRWLEGRVAAGLGQREEAMVTLSRVREEFSTRRIPYDTALASLELAVLYLEAGRTAETRRLARDLAWVFQAQGVHREALAALRLFCQAAEREEATAELARRIATYLHRARHDPELRFQAAE